MLARDQDGVGVWQGAAVGGGQLPRGNQAHVQIESLERRKPGVKVLLLEHVPLGHAQRVRLEDHQAALQACGGGCISRSAGGGTWAERRPAVRRVATREGR